MNPKYNYFYKITNNINNHFYYGVHSTDNLNDGYMGSGKRLHLAYKKYGIENFSKEILEFFDTPLLAYEYEAEMVTEALVADPSCYNLKCGGSGGDCNMTTAKDKEGNFLFVNKNDVRFKTGELVGATKGIGVYFNTATQQYVHVTSEEAKSNPYIILATKNKVYCLNKQGEKCVVTREEFRKNRENYISHSEGKVVYKDKQGKCYHLRPDDKLVQELKLVPNWTGLKHSEATKAKMRASHVGKQKGEKNSRYGCCWVCKGKENVSIHKSELPQYLSMGYEKGRFIEEKPLPYTKEELLSMREKYKVKEICENLHIAPSTWTRWMKRIKKED